MEKQGVTQRELADRSGVTFTYVNRILLQKQTPSLEICDRIADALGVNLSKLLEKSKKLSKSA